MYAAERFKTGRRTIVFRDPQDRRCTARCRNTPEKASYGQTRSLSREETINVRIQFSQLNARNCADLPV